METLVGAKLLSDWEGCVSSYKLILYVVKLQDLLPVNNKLKF